jgi:hypothetical protein
MCELDGISKELLGVISRCVGSVPCPHAILWWNSFRLRK